MEVLYDRWDLRPGDDFLKFMERGVRDADRVLMICTEAYSSKANDGVGGVGYEAMIITGDLVRDLGKSLQSSAAMLIAISAIVPSIFLVIPMMIAIVVTFAWPNNAAHNETNPP